MSPLATLIVGTLGGFGLGLVAAHFYRVWRRSQRSYPPRWVEHDGYRYDLVGRVKR